MGRDLSDFLLPERPHHGRATAYYQRRTATQYLILLAFGTLGFLYTETPFLKVAAMGAFFPGSAFVALRGWWLVGVPLSCVLWPVALFCWFGAGMLAAPLGIWILTTGIATLAAYVNADRVQSSPYALAGSYGIVAVCSYYTIVPARRRMAEELERRAARNVILGKTMGAHFERIAANEAKMVAPEEREMTEEQMNTFRDIIDTSLQQIDDWTNYTIIDQFQTAALRYQLYGIIYTMAFSQSTYTPAFDGYSGEGMRKTIEKSMIPKVMNYWKWESLWGKFTTNYEPVERDNIMFTGWFLLALCNYTISTGDDRYSKEGCLKIEIDKDHVYAHNTHSIAKAMTDNFNKSSYCLFPCEPNWIYTICNLMGMNGMLCYDAVYGATAGKQVQDRFTRAFMEEFATVDGSILPIRSAITGLTIPGLAGTLSDGCVALAGSASLPDIARRNYEIVKAEVVKFDPVTKDINIKSVGADKIDTGNYKPSEVTKYATLCGAAREYGDYVLADALIARSEKEAGKTVDENGKITYPGASLGLRCEIARTKMLYQGDFRRFVLEGPAKANHLGPRLDSVPYPQVTVLKCFSDGKNLDIVLGNGIKSAAGDPALLTFSRLVPSATYRCGETTFEADAKGTAEATVIVKGRTPVKVERL